MPKLLFDNNISHRVLARLDGHFRGSSHVMLENLDRASDKEVWEFAKNEGFAIVTKDSDFNDLTLLYGTPPKIVWIKTGNCRVDDIVKILLHERETIAAFLEAEGLAILELR
ncbi:DUF5615 family PIN-like protein [Hydrogenimonas sp.]